MAHPYTKGPPDSPSSRNLPIVLSPSDQASIFTMLEFFPDYKLLGFCTFIIIFVVFYVRRESSSPFPPGPKRLPFIGNLLQFPHDMMGYRIAEWSKYYGDVIYLTIFSRKFLVLNSSRASLDLLQDRGITYSARPHLVMAGDLVGRRNSVLFHQYDETLKKHRRLLHQCLNQRRIVDYKELLENETLRLLSALAEHPEQHMAHLRRNAGAIALQIAYGYKVGSYNRPDQFVFSSEELNRILNEAAEPGKWLVDSFPWLRFAPEWFPGAGFKRWARITRVQSEAIAEKPFLYSKRLMTEGKGTSSFVSESTELLEQEAGRGLNTQEEYILKWASAGIYAGGSDTTVAFTTSFMLFMAVFPDVQATAQAELDTIVGTDRLPGLQDQEQLPYIDALIKECHRFNPIVPLIPHANDSDDEYRGCLIPKGTWIMANTCAIMYDPIEFPEPKKFWPERFLDGSCKVDPRDYAFGFGRRRCPGVNLANASTFMTISNILSIFTISGSKDAAGKPRPLPLAFTSGHVSHPQPFKCEIKPRSAASAALLKQLLLAKSDAVGRD